MNEVYSAEYNRTVDIMSDIKLHQKINEEINKFINLFNNKYNTNFNILNIQSIIRGTWYGDIFQCLVVYISIENYNKIIEYMVSNKFCTSEEAKQFKAYNTLVSIKLFRDMRKDIIMDIYLNENKINVNNTELTLP